MRGSGDSISREAAREAVWQILNGMGYSEKHNDRLVEEVDAILGDIPAADVRPVARGKWAWNDNNGYYFCDKCGTVSTRENQDGDYIDCPDFCPNCGADMRQEASDG